MKKLMLIFFLFASSLFALDTKLGLELARSKQLSKVIDRVNTIHEYINLYILETASLPTNMTDITNKYPNIQNINGFNNQQISFSITTNRVTYTNVVSTATPMSRILQQVYRNSPNLHPNAIVNPNFSMSIGLNPDAVKFYNNAQRLRNGATLATSDNNANTLVSDSVSLAAVNVAAGINFFCNNGNERGRLWYEPDGIGGYMIHRCETTGWGVAGANKPNIVIYRATIVELQSLVAPVGTKAAVTNGANVNEYISVDPTNSNPTLRWRQIQ